jgi:hypothetical protein
VEAMAPLQLLVRCAFCNKIGLMVLDCMLAGRAWSQRACDFNSILIPLGACLFLSSFYLLQNKSTAMDELRHPNSTLITLKVSKVIDELRHPNSTLITQHWRYQLRRPESMKSNPGSGLRL